MGIDEKTTCVEKRNWIIYLAIYTIWERDYDRYGINYYINKGYDVEIWRIIDRGHGEWGIDNRDHRYRKIEYRKLPKLINSMDKRNTVFIVDDEAYYLMIILAVNRCHYIKFFSKA